MSASSKDSRSITWHQWHAAYPTDRKIGLSSPRACANASSPQGYQSTGLSACWRGTGSSPSRVDSPPAIASRTVCASGSTPSCRCRCLRWMECGRARVGDGAGPGPHARLHHGVSATRVSRSSVRSATSTRRGPPLPMFPSTCSRSSSQGLRSRSCATLPPRSAASGSSGSTDELDPEVGAAVIAAGAAGVMVRTDDERTVPDTLRRAAAGELILPAAHLAALVELVRASRFDQEGSGSDSLTRREREVLALARRRSYHARGRGRRCRSA